MAGGKCESIGKTKRKGSIGTSVAWKGFAFAGIATCTAETVTIPIDVTKTRMQLRGELGTNTPVRGGPLSVARHMVQTEGPKALFKGLIPALLRQSSYGTIRYGSYEPIKQALGADDSGNCPFWKKVLAGCICGVISSSIANPTDVVKVRMQADTSIDNPRYKGTFDAFRTITKAEGIRGLWSGVIPTSSRAAVGAMTELSCYDEIKQRIVASEYFSTPSSVHFASALAAGLISTFAMNPFDVAKSRMMNQTQGIKYNGMLDCFAKSVRAEGIGSLWKGFIPSYARIGPRVVIIFMVLEKLREEFD